MTASRGAAGTGGRRLCRIMLDVGTAVSFVLAVAVAALWVRNAFASDVYTRWWFVAEERSQEVGNGVTAWGWYQGRRYGPTRIYNEFTCRAHAGSLVLRFVRREGDPDFQSAVETRAARGLRPASGSLTVLRDAPRLARGRAILGRSPLALTGKVEDPPSPFALRGWAVGAPFWLLVLAMLALPALRAVAWARRRRRVRGGACATCGYDLRASPGRCPECGSATPVA